MLKVKSSIKYKSFEDNKDKRVKITKVIRKNRKVKINKMYKDQRVLVKEVQY